MAGAVLRHTHVCTPGPLTKAATGRMQWPVVNHWEVCVGMEVRVRSAELHIDDDAMAVDVFYLTNIWGRKLSEGRALEVADRGHVPFWIPAIWLLCLGLGCTLTSDFRFGGTCHVIKWTASVRDNRFWPRA